MKLLPEFQAETVIAKVVRTKSINLTDLIKCDSWELESSEMSKPLLTEDTSSGAYKCPSSEDAVLLLVYGTQELSSTNIVNYQPNS